MLDADRQDLKALPPPDETTLTVGRMDGGPDLVIEQAQVLAYDFFTLDDSSVGPSAYDQHVGKGDPNRIAVDDVWPSTPACGPALRIQPGSC